MFYAYFSEKLKEDVILNFTFKGSVLANTEKYKEVVKPLPAVTMTANTTKVTVTLTATHVGRVAIGLSSSDERLERWPQEKIQFCHKYIPVLCPLNSRDLILWTILSIPLCCLHPAG